MNRSLLIALLAGCTGADIDAASTTSESALNLAPADAQRVLDFVNYPGTDAALLDGAVGLDTRAAANILRARNGADGIAPSADDRPFTTLAALDAVSYVGDTALAKLASYSSAHPAPAGQTLESVVFAGWEAEAVMFGVNSAPQADLDALLDSRSVTWIVAHRPLAGLPVLAAAPYVGTTALGKLRAHALAWWAQLRGGSTPVLAGTFDGVTFDEATAKTALEIANQATYTELSSHGVPGTGAAPIVGNRPYTTLAQVSAVSGVGPATMSGLKAYAQSGQWAVPAACITSFENAVGPKLPDLLFLSESDRPFDLVSFPGQGTTTLTHASFFALLHKPAGWSFDTRYTPDNYYVALEPASATADPNAAAAVQAAFGTLTDVIYVKVYKPASDPYHAEVDVYLVGRTTCGDVVGIHSIAVET